MKPYPKISEKTNGTVPEEKMKPYPTVSEEFLLKVYRIGSIEVAAMLEDSDGVKEHIGLGSNLTEALESLEDSLCQIRIGSISVYTTLEGSDGREGHIGLGTIPVSTTLEDSDGVKKRMGLGTHLTEALKSQGASLCQIVVQELPDGHCVCGCCDPGDSCCDGIDCPECSADRIVQL